MRVLVLGAGVSGKAAARLLRRAGHEAVVYDSAPSPLAELREEEFEVHNGTWTSRLFNRVDLVVTSPGFKPSQAPLLDAASSGVPIVSEIELGARYLGATRIAAVTGTNGKSTVTDLIARMLDASEISAVAAGNIGLPLSDIALSDEVFDVAVVEASSFQLHYIDGFHAEVAVLLNVAPDHLDWHGSLEAYAAAKARIFENQRPEDLLIIDRDDPGAVAVTSGSTSKLVRVSGRDRTEDGIGPEGGKLWLGQLALDIPDRVVGDSSYLVDFAAAGAASTEMGASIDGVSEVIGAFEPGPHRRSVVGEWDGVRWINDSKATNPHAAAAAAAAYPSVILIAGGRDKGLDLTPITTIPTVKHIVAIGEAEPFLASALPSGGLTSAATLEEAINMADWLAVRGDTVLLSPGCASFDMFDNYRHRGDVFTSAVMLKKGKR